MKSIPEMVRHFRYMEMTVPNSGMLREARWQYEDMANGGDGGPLGFEENGETTCRGINYPSVPDSYFQEICDLLGWTR